VRYWNLLVLPLIAWLYAPVLARLFLQWVNDPNFSHGIFVPLFALFVLWQDRKRLKAIPSAPSWAGIPLVVLSLLVLVLGVLGADIFLPRVSLLILLAGLIILFQGWTFFRAVLFPWAFLILMIPPPTLIINQITFPLQLLAARLSTALLHLAGVPALRDGYVIQIPTTILDIVEAESGIRSLLALLTVAIIYGNLADNRKWVRVVLACSAVPIAVAASSLRIFGAGILAQYWDPDAAGGFFHVYSGLLMFVVSLIMLFILHRMISHVWKKSPEQKSWESPQMAMSSQPGDLKGWALRFAVAAAFMVATALFLQPRLRGESLPSREALSSLPVQIGGWAGQDIRLDQQTLDILKPDEVLLRDYENPSQPQQSIDLFITYSPTQNVGGQTVSPAHTLPGAGWVPTSREVVQITGPDGSSFPANRYVVSKGQDRQLVLYWFQAHGREVASEYWAKYYLVSDSARMNRSDGGLVRLMTPMLEGESRDAAQARLMNFGSHLLPMLDRYIPR
jgi:exosortase D (VPLPA-CTERM-specific)